MTFTLRDFRSEDAVELAPLARLAWTTTYRDIYAPSFVDEFLNRHYSLPALEACIAPTQRGEARFTVASDETDAMVGFCHIGLNQDQRVELYRIYLRPDLIGQGAGRLLLGDAESFASDLGKDRYHCYVQCRNDVGKGFYVRNGFIRQPEFDQDDHWYLLKVLNPVA